jgi:hypothetical protein
MLVRACDVAFGVTSDEAWGFAASAETRPEWFEEVVAFPG